MKKGRRLLIECLANISYPIKTIEEKMQEQDRPTVPAPNSKDEAKMYQDLLNMIRSDKKQELAKEFELIEELEKEAAPRSVINKKLWNKIEKNVREHGKYSEKQVYKVVQRAYQKAGGEYTHKSKVAGKTIDNMIQGLIKDQEAQIAKEKVNKADEVGLKFYEGLLKQLKPEKAPNIEYFKFLDEDELPPPSKL